LMEESGGDGVTITALQIETAREVAQLVPGAAFETRATFIPRWGEIVADLRCLQPLCGLPADVFTFWVNMSEGAATHTTTFSQTISGSFPSAVNNQFLLFIDVDRSRRTGATPARLGFPTRFQGAELVTQVVIRGDPPYREIIPTVWQFRNGKFVLSKDRRIRAEISDVINPITKNSVATKVSIILPNYLRGIAKQFRIQALAQRLGDGGQFHRIPETSGAARVMKLIGRHTG